MKTLYLVYQLLVSPVLAVLTALTAIVTVVGSCFNGHIWGYYPGKVWSRLFCYLLLLPVRVKRNPLVEKDKSYVFVANHQGAFDIFLIYGFLNRNFKWMMKKSLRKIPFIGKACESAGHIFVDKSGPKKIYATVSRAHKVLQGGTSLVVFPEGSRTYTGHMNAFRKGAFLLADELQLPVVPLTISGSFDVMPRTGKFVSRHPLTLTIHDPIYPHTQGHENIERLAKESYQVIESALPEKYRGKAK